MKTKLTSWVEWKEKCALARCQSATQVDIQEWAVPIFISRLKDANVSASLLQKMSEKCGNGISVAWDRIEIHYHEVSPTKGILWKDWLVAGVKNSPDKNPHASFERLTQTRILHVTTDLKRNDQKQIDWTSNSLDELVNNGEPDGLTRGEVIKCEKEFAPDVAAAWEELAKIAEKEAELAFKRLSSREALALGCKAADINESQHRDKILPYAGCAWSQYNVAVSTAKTKTAEIIQELAEKYTESDPSDLNFFKDLFHRAFQSCCMEHLPPEILSLTRSYEEEI